MGKENELLEKFIRFVSKDEIKKKFHDSIIDPLLNHVMERVFPYLVFTCVLFVLLLLTVMLTLGIIIFQLRKGVLSIHAVAPT